jgi:hypothetical protein
MPNLIPTPQGAFTGPFVQAPAAEHAQLVTFPWPPHVPRVVNSNHVVIVDPFDAWDPPDNLMLYPDEHDPEFIPTRY